MPMCRQRNVSPALKPASRTKGMACREKYMARSFASITTLHPDGMAASDSSRIGDAAVAMSHSGSAVMTSTRRSIKTGSMSGSSPWIFTTIPSASADTASATRSVPEG